MKPPGPLQLYDVPPDDVRLMVAPTQTGLLELAVAAGRALITTLAVAVAVHPLTSVTVTV